MAIASEYFSVLEELLEAKAILSEESNAHVSENLWKDVNHAKTAHEAKEIIKIYLGDYLR